MFRLFVIDIVHTDCWHRMQGPQDIRLQHIIQRSGSGLACTLGEPEQLSISWTHGDASQDEPAESLRVLLQLESNASCEKWLAQLNK